jgi:hypothetical protein
MVSLAVRMTARIGGLAAHALAQVFCQRQSAADFAVNW